ncbi:response regulator [Endothiovibrio diazotrophicus]
MSRLRLLVVDDATFIRDFIRKGIRSKYPDFLIDEAIHGKQAQQFLEKAHYDIILCDWEMPEMSGEELLHWVRTHPEMSKTPFVMVTSRGDREHVVKAVQAGVDNYVVKPFTIDGLLSKVGQALKKAGVSTRPTRQEGPASDSVSILTGGAKTPPKRPMGHAAGSVDVLTGGAKSASPRPQGKPQSPAADSVAILTGGKPAAVPTASKAPMPTAQLRFADQMVRSVIKDIKLAGLELVTRREDPLPNLLEPVVVDIEASQVNETLRMNAFVHRIQANPPSQQATQYQLGVTFADDDPMKNENLARFITTLRGG